MATKDYLSVFRLIALFVVIMVFLALVLAYLFPDVANQPVQERVYQDSCVEVYAARYCLDSQRGGETCLRWDYNGNDQIDPTDLAELLMNRDSFDDEWCDG